jgi:hypothetical protein
MANDIVHNNLQDNVGNALDAPNSSQVVEPAGSVKSDVEGFLNAWILRLRACGVAFELSGNRLRVQPWKSLTTEDQATLRAHRVAIKNLVRAGLPDPLSPIATTTTERAAPAIDPAILRIINWNTPEERQRRAQEATAVAVRMMWQTSPYL